MQAGFTRTHTSPSRPIVPEVNYDLLCKSSAKEPITETNAGKQRLIFPPATRAHADGRHENTHLFTVIVCLFMHQVPPADVVTKQLQPKGNQKQELSLALFLASKVPHLVRYFHLSILWNADAQLLHIFLHQQRLNTAWSNERANSNQHPSHWCRPNLLRYAACPGGPGSGVIASVT